MIILFFIFGLIVGSFLNALIHRLHSRQSMLNDRSRCVHCGHKLSASDLVPLISFAFLSGKCRYCKKTISWQYPAVELATALAFSWYYLVFGMGTDLLFYMFAVSLLIVIGVFDLKHYLILDRVVLTGLVLTVTFWLWRDISSGVNLLSFDSKLVSGLLAGSILLVFFGLQYWFSSGRWIGFGDVKFGFLLGMITGFPLILAVLMLSYFLGSIVGVGLILSGRKELSSRMPFGTFLATSAILILPYIHRIAEMYRDYSNL